MLFALSDCGLRNLIVLLSTFPNTSNKNLQKDMSPRNVLQRKLLVSSEIFQVNGIKTSSAPPPHPPKKSL